MQDLIHIAYQSMKYLENEGFWLKMSYELIQVGY